MGSRMTPLHMLLLLGQVRTPGCAVQNASEPIKGSGYTVGHLVQMLEAKPGLCCSRYDGPHSEHTNRFRQRLKAI